VVLFAGVWHTAAKKLGKKEQRGAGKTKAEPTKNGNQFFDFILQFHCKKCVKFNRINRKLSIFIPP